MMERLTRGCMVAGRRGERRAARCCAPLAYVCVCVCAGERKRARPAKDSYTGTRKVQVCVRCDRRNGGVCVETRESS